MRRTALVGVLAAALAAGGCGGAADHATAPATSAAEPTTAATVPLPEPTTPPTEATMPVGMADLAGRTFLLDEAAVDGSPRALVDGEAIEVGFGVDGTIGAATGCNGIGSEIALDAQGLLVGDERGEVTSTAMLCSQPPMNQDSWVAAVLLAHPTVTLDGDRIQLRTPDTVLRGRDQRAVPPRAPLPGTEWAIASVVEGRRGWGAAWMADARLLLGLDGPLRLESACGTVTGTYAVDGSAFLARDVRVEDGACRDGADTATSLADAVRILADARHAVGLGERLRLVEPGGARVELGPPP